MSSSLEPSSSCKKQEDSEAMSNYAESYESDCEVDPEELQNRTLFDKPRGERRWLGKKHHREKERLHNAMKDRTFIEKTVKSTEPLSKNATEKIEASTKDDLALNVVYSMDKKNRWRDANTVTLLAGAPENLNAEVVEKNGLAKCGFWNSNDNTFAVHSKQVNPEDESGEFEIRSATSSGKGQDYSNFLPATREFSKKANAKMMIVRGEEQDSEKETVTQPTISYNIYKTHQSKDVVGSQMFRSKIVSKSGRHRTNKKVDIEYYDDDEESFEDDSEDVMPQHQTQTIFDLSTHVVEKRGKQPRKNKRKDSELSYEVVDALEPEPEYTNLFNIQEFLRDEGYMFEEADVTFHNQQANFEHQINELREEKKLKIKDLRPNQYLIDVSEWCQLDGEIKDGEMTTVIVITHLKNTAYNILVNSTIAIHPSKKGQDYLRRKISSAISIREAISRLTSEILTYRQIIETMKLSSSFYGRKTVPELLHDSYEWENQLIHMKWTNQHYHATWANSEELSTVGGKLEWNDLCGMVKKESQLKTGYTFDDICGVCSQKKRSHELFLVENESKIKCTDCLRDEFYREFIAKRLPIDLQTDTADELEYLPTFIPLTLLNLYIRMVSETIYKDLGASGDLEKCPSCKSAVFFEALTEGNEKMTQNRSCPCGYSWCRDCKKVPHWPLNCKEYFEWEKKWLLRYAMINAQGTGTEILLQITCSCAKVIYNVLHPEDLIECPGCKINANLNTMQTVWKHHYFPFDPRFRKLVEDGIYVIGQSYDEIPYVPRAVVYNDIAKIPGIKASVIEICGAARDIRYDVHFRNRAVNREHILIRKNIMEEEVVENLFGTVVYLVENITAWMYVTNQYDRNIKNTLESMMENRKILMKKLEGENSEAIKECIKKLRREISSVVLAVEKKIDCSENV